jgi:hypothetical protein
LLRTRAPMNGPRIGPIFYEVQCPHPTSKKLKSQCLIFFSRTQSFFKSAKAPMHAILSIHQRRSDPIDAFHRVLVSQHANLKGVKEGQEEGARLCSAVHAHRRSPRCQRSIEIQGLVQRSDESNQKLEVSLVVALENVAIHRSRCFVDGKREAVQEEKTAHFWIPWHSIQPQS